MSKQVISTLKKRMTLEERRKFATALLEYSQEWGSGNVDRDIEGLSLEALLKERVRISIYYKFHSRFTPEELSYTINLKEL